MMATSDEGFDLLPAGVELAVDDEFAAEEGFEDAPFAPPEEEDTPAPPPLGSSPSYDFIAQTFQPIRAGGAQRVRGLAALVQWCEKCLLTRQGEASAVDARFGVTITAYDLVEDGVLDPSELAEALDDWTRAFRVHPRISDVGDWSVELSDDEEQVLVSCTVDVEGMADPVPVDLTLGA